MLIIMAEIDGTYLLLGALDQDLAELKHFLDLSILKTQLQLFLNKSKLTFIFNLIFSLSTTVSSKIYCSSNTSSTSGSTITELLGSEKTIEFMACCSGDFLFPQDAK